MGLLASVRIEAVESLGLGTAASYGSLASWIEPGIPERYSQTSVTIATMIRARRTDMNCSSESQRAGQSGPEERRTRGCRPPDFRCVVTHEQNC